MNQSSSFCTPLYLLFSTMLKEKKKYQKYIPLAKSASYESSHTSADSRDKPQPDADTRYLFFHASKTREAIQTLFILAGNRSSAEPTI